jgi:hypothetical protein
MVRFGHNSQFLYTFSLLPAGTDLPIRLGPGKQAKIRRVTKALAGFFCAKRHERLD